MQVSVFHENILGKEQRKKMGKINYRMGNKTSEWFFLHWHQHISMVSRNKEKSCFIHKSAVRVYLMLRAQLCSDTFTKI